MHHQPQPEGLPQTRQEAPKCRRNRFRPRASTPTSTASWKRSTTSTRAGWASWLDKAVLSDEEQVEETTLKKKKLQIKDRMQEITRRSRGATAHP